MSDLTIKEQFPIAPEQTSLRIFFAKESKLDTRWHLCDAAVGKHKLGVVEYFVALHGKWMPIAERVDTVLQLEIVSGASDVICEKCLDEFNLAIETIKERKFLKFE